MIIKLSGPFGLLLRPICKPRFAYGEEPPAGGGTGAGTGTTGATGTGATGTGTPPPQEKLIPQSKVDEIVQARIAENVNKANKAMEQLKELENIKIQNAEDLKNYKIKLEEVQANLRTKEQQAAFEADKMKKEATENAEKLQKEAVHWKDKYTSTKIVNEIVQASNLHKAFDSTQIMSILGPKAKLVESIDDAGQPTGEYDVKIEWDDVDKDGKPIRTPLNPADAVKAMRQKANFANLFLAEGGGTGYVPPTRGSQIAGSSDVRNMSAEDFIEKGGRERAIKASQKR